MLFSDSLETMDVPKEVIDNLLNQFESVFVELNPGLNIVSLEPGEPSEYDDSQIHYMKGFDYVSDFNEASPLNTISNVALEAVRRNHQIGDFWSNISMQIGYIEEDGAYTYIIDRR